MSKIKEIICCFLCSFLCIVVLAIAYRIIQPLLASAIVYSRLDEIKDKPNDDPEAAKKAVAVAYYAFQNNVSDELLFKCIKEVKKRGDDVSATFMLTHLIMINPSNTAYYFERSLSLLLLNRIDNGISDAEMCYKIEKSVASCEYLSHVYYKYDKSMRVNAIQLAKEAINLSKQKNTPKETGLLQKRLMYILSK